MEIIQKFTDSGYSYKPCCQSIKWAILNFIFKIDKDNDGNYGLRIKDMWLQYCPFCRARIMIVGESKKNKLDKITLYNINRKGDVYIVDKINEIIDWINKHG